MPSVLYALPVYLVYLAIAFAGRDCRPNEPARGDRRAAHRSMNRRDGGEASRLAAVTGSYPLWKTLLAPVATILVLTARISPARLLVVRTRFVWITVRLVVRLAAWSPLIVRRTVTPVFRPIFRTGLVRRRIVITVFGTPILRLRLILLRAILVRRRMELVLAAIICRPYDTWPGKLRGALRCGDRRTTMVAGVVQRAITASLVDVLRLGRSRADMPLAVPTLFIRRRPRIHAVRSTVVTDSVVDVYVADHRAINVHVVNLSDVHVGHRAVVIELTIAPFASNVSRSKVSEAVIDPAVKSDVRSPIAGMPNVIVAIRVVTPPARSPIQPGVGSKHPRAWDPVVTIRPPCPVTGNPDEIRAWANRLCIDG